MPRMLVMKEYLITTQALLVHRIRSELGMASVRLDHSIGKVSVVADLGFGKRAEDFSYNDANTMLAIKQAYLRLCSF